MKWRNMKNSPLPAWPLAVPCSVVWRCSLGPLAHSGPLQRLPVSVYSLANLLQRAEVSSAPSRISVYTEAEQNEVSIKQWGQLSDTSCQLNPPTFFSPKCFSIRACSWLLVHRMLGPRFLRACVRLVAGIAAISLADNAVTVLLKSRIIWAGLDSDLRELRSRVFSLCLGRIKERTSNYDTIEIQETIQIFDQRR